MGSRRWQVPSIVAASAASALSADPASAARLRHLATRSPVGTDTLLAIVASDAPLPVSEWAIRVYEQTVAAETSRVADTLVAAGMDLDSDAYGVLDPNYDGERICAVVRTSDAGTERWGTDGWSPSPDPEGLEYVELNGDVLADALDAVGSGGSLILSPSTPRAWVSPRSPSVLVAAVSLVKDETPTPGTGQTFAVTDPLDTTAVLSLFQVAPGPKITVRRGGAWVPDDGTLLGQLKSISPPPVIAVPPEQLDATIRQVDDYDITHPSAAAHPTGSFLNKSTIAASAGDHSNDAMVALPVPGDVANKLAVDGGEDPSDMHVTLAYLGDIADLPDEDKLLQLVSEWAQTVHSPIEGQISGPAMFTGGDEPVAVALPDLPALPQHRQNLVNSLEGAGVPVDQEHGYTPHITVQYGASDTSDVGNHDLSFPGAALYYGNNVHYVPFGQPDESEPVVAAASSKHHARRVREALDADAKFDADRAAADLAERGRRRQFEQTIAGRYHALVADNVDPDEASTAVAREVRAEDARRELWEKDRSDSLLVEKERRLRAQPAIRLSAELTRRVAEHKTAPAKGADPVVAAGKPPRTMMPPQLVDYWTHGEGAAKIRWGTHGDYERAVRHLLRYMGPYQAHAAANELHRIATGMWPSQHAKLVRKAEGRH